MAPSNATLLTKAVFMQDDMHSYNVKNNHIALALEEVLGKFNIFV